MKNGLIDFDHIVDLILWIMTLNNIFSCYKIFYSINYDLIYWSYFHILEYQRSYSG
jgi:hypothetical protein